MPHLCQQYGKLWLWSNMRTESECVPIHANVSKCPNKQRAKQGGEYLHSIWLQILTFTVSDSSACRFFLWQRPQDCNHNSEENLMTWNTKQPLHERKRDSKSRVTLTGQFIRYLHGPCWHDSITHLWFESPLLPHLKAALSHWDLETVEVVWVEWTHYVQETSLIWAFWHGVLSCSKQPSDGALWS